MSMAHICHGLDGVGVGVRGVAEFCAWNQVQVSHCQTASSCKQQGFGGSLMELVELFVASFTFLMTG